MKTIGLIGGMSWESTVTYYQIVNHVVQQRLGGLHSARLLLDSLDFAEIEACQSSGDWEKSARLLTDAALRLEGAGADLVLICTNTMHKVAPQVQAARRGSPPRRRGGHRSAAGDQVHHVSGLLYGKADRRRDPGSHSRRDRRGAGQPGHLRRALPWNFKRGLQAGIPPRHQCPGAKGRPRRHSGLHRDRPAGLPGGHPPPRL